MPRDSKPLSCSPTTSEKPKLKRLAGSGSRAAPVHSAQSHAARHRRGGARAVGRRGEGANTNRGPNRHRGSAPMERLAARHCNGPEELLQWLGRHAGEFDQVPVLSACRRLGDVVSSTILAGRRLGFDSLRFFRLQMEPSVGGEPDSWTERAACSAACMCSPAGRSVTCITSLRSRAPLSPGHAWRWSGPCLGAHQPPVCRLCT